MGIKRKTLPSDVIRKLWVKAAGRCEYEGCNKLLYRDDLTEQEMNTAYIAHIVSASVDGPRGHPTRSLALELELSNLMLLCDVCHRRIDREQLSAHPEERLLKMKTAHENRIELVTSISPEKKSHIIIYTAKVGDFEIQVPYLLAAQAMMNEKFPNTNRPIELGIKNGMVQDHTPEYWQQQTRQLEESFKKFVTPLLGNDPVQDFSVFAFAPQALLIKLGTLLSDKYPTTIYQYHRNSYSWKWSTSADPVDFKILPPINKTNTPVLIFSLSGTVGKNEIEPLFNQGCSIWEITIDKPFVDFLNTRELLSHFIKTTRLVFDEIKKIHGTAPLHIFPAMPVSSAVELGRLWLSKADMPLIIYDKHTVNNGFTKALEIQNKLYD